MADWYSEIAKKIESDRRESQAVKMIRTAIEEGEGELRKSALRRSFSDAARQLTGAPGWQKLQATLREQEEQTLNALRHMPDPEPVPVAKLQAYLRAISLMVLDPLEPEELAQMEAEDSMRREKLDELRMLIPDRHRKQKP